MSWSVIKEGCAMYRHFPCTMAPLFLVCVIFSGFIAAQAVGHSGKSTLNQLLDEIEYDELYNQETQLLDLLSAQNVDNGAKMSHDYGYDYQQNAGYGHQSSQRADSYGSPYQQQQHSGGYGQGQSQGHRGGYGHERGGYRMRKKKKAYKVVKLPQKKEKKMKIISIDKGFYVPGGTQMFGKFSSLKGCMKACASTPNCFAGDYNPWFGRCYLHSNISACDTLRAHKKLTHFKKVPCDVPESTNGLIILGVQIFRGLEQKGIDSLTDCVKKCATAGEGIAEDFTAIGNQICFGIDYDFATHKCYFHVQNADICNDEDPITTPESVVANPSTVFIALCPAMAG